MLYLSPGGGLGPDLGNLVSGGFGPGFATNVVIFTDEGLVVFSGENALTDFSEWVFGADPGDYPIYTPKGGSLNFYLYFHGYRALKRDVSEGSFTFSVKRRLVDESPVLELTNGNGIYPHGKHAVRVHIPSTVLNNLSKDNHYTLMYQALGNEETVLQGNFHVDPTVTELTVS